MTELIFYAQRPYITDLAPYYHGDPEISRYVLNSAVTEKGTNYDIPISAPGAVAWVLWEYDRYTKRMILREWDTVRIGKHEKFILKAGSFSTYYGTGLISE